MSRTKLSDSVRHMMRIRYDSIPENSGEVTEIIYFYHPPPLPSPFLVFQSFFLDHLTLVLLAVDAVVLPDRDGRDGKDEECSRSDTCLLFVIAPR